MFSGFVLGSAAAADASRTARMYGARASQLARQVGLGVLRECFRSDILFHPSGASEARASRGTIGEHVCEGRGYPRRARPLSCGAPSTWRRGRKIRSSAARKRTRCVVCVGVPPGCARVASLPLCVCGAGLPVLCRSRIRSHVVGLRGFRWRMLRSCGLRACVTFGLVFAHPHVVSAPCGARCVCVCDLRPSVLRLHTRYMGILYLPVFLVMCVLVVCLCGCRCASRPCVRVALAHLVGAAKDSSAAARD